jgi:hypothetical protein
VEHDPEAIWSTQPDPLVALAQAGLTAGYRRG